MAAVVVAFIGALGVTGPRPQLAGAVLLVVTVDAWLRTADDGRPRWWLVPLTWLWACTHGGWVIGIAVGLLVSLAGLLDHPGRPLSRRLLPFAVPALGGVAALLTPVGPRLLGAMGQIGQISEFINEWQAPSLLVPFMAFTMGGIAVIVVAALTVPNYPLNWARIVLLAFAAASAMTYLRTIAVGALVMAPLLAEALQALIGRSPTPPSRVERSVALGGVALALVVAGLALPSIARDPGEVPVGLSPRLAELGPQVIYDEIALGGWIMHAHPQLTPVIDTRSEVFGRAYLEDYRVVERAARGWEAKFDAAHARVALLLEDSPLASALVAQRGWQAMGADAGYVLLVAPG